MKAGRWVAILGFRSSLAGFCLSISLVFRRKSWHALGAGGTVCSLLPDLVNHALMPLLFHVLGHCAVPAYIMTWLERQIRGFLWDHDPDVWKWHQVGWSSLCRSRELGGAGMLNIRHWTEALMRKQAFRISASPDEFWPSWVRERYNFVSWSENALCHSSSRNWKRLVKAGRSIEGGIAIIADEGDGSSITTVWSEACLISPRVKDFYTTDEDLDSFSLTPEYCRIWKSRCSPSMKIFLWKICIGKLPVRARISRWLAIPGDCSKCHGTLETMDHVLFSCSFALDVWAVIKAKWPDLHWPTSVSLFMEGLFHRPRQGKYHAWLLISASVLWLIWKARNANIFGGEEKPANVIAHLAVAAAEELYFLDKAHLCRRAARRSILDLPSNLLSWSAPPQAGYAKEKL